MMNCGFGLDLKIGVWLFVRQYKELCPICNKFGGIKVPRTYQGPVPHQVVMLIFSL
jgi:hypothetical protein